MTGRRAPAAALIVDRALGLITVQDLGRPGRMHEAIPIGGALVRERLIAANRAVRNPDDAAALEVLGGLTVRADAPILVATDVTGARPLAAGEAWAVVSAPRRVTYLAVRGGLDVPVVLGGRGALLCAELGGVVRAGQRFAIGAAPAVDVRAAPAAADGWLTAAGDAPIVSIRITRGPDAAAFAPGGLAALTAAPYRVLPTSDRVGTRLAGPVIARSDAADRSRPMVIGALEVPRDGQPIVLGPEHPTTGGYPIAAVVATAELGRLFSIALGGAVQFTW